MQQTMDERLKESVEGFDLQEVSFYRASLCECWVSHSVAWLHCRVDEDSGSGSGSNKCLFEKGNWVEATGCKPRRSTTGGGGSGRGGLLVFDVTGAVGLSKIKPPPSSSVSDTVDFVDESKVNNCIEFLSGSFHTVDCVVLDWTFVDPSQTDSSNGSSGINSSSGIGIIEITAREIMFGITVFLSYTLPLPMVRHFMKQNQTTAKPFSSLPWLTRYKRVTVKWASVVHYDAKHDILSLRRSDYTVIETTTSGGSGAGSKSGLTWNTSLSSSSPLLQFGEKYEAARIRSLRDNHCCLLASIAVTVGGMCYVSNRHRINNISIKWRGGFAANLLPNSSVFMRCVTATDSRRCDTILIGNETGGPDTNSADVLPPSFVLIPDCLCLGSDNLELTANNVGTLNSCSGVYDLVVVRATNLLGREMTKTVTTTADIFDHNIVLHIYRHV